MKYKRIIGGISAIASLVLISCEMKMNKPDFDVAVTPTASAKVIGDTVYVLKNEPIEFAFSGNPDNVSYWSGESGKEYINRSRTFIEKKCLKSELSLNIARHYGPNTPKQAIRMYYTTDKIDIERKFKTDSTVVRNTNWIEIKTSDGKSIDPLTRSWDFYSKGPFDMTHITGKFRIAIVVEHPKKEAAENHLSTTTFRIQMFQFKNNVEGEGNPIYVKAADMGLQPLFMSNYHYSTFYNNDPSLGAGATTLDQYRTFNPYWAYIANPQMPSTMFLWNFASISSANQQIEYGGGNITNVHPGFVYGYEAWLISKELDLNRTYVTPDAGVAIKNMSERLSIYAYTYDKIGTYKASITANSTTIEKTLTAPTKEFNIKVVDILP